MTSENPAPEARFYGVGVSPGIAQAKIHVMSDDLEEVPRHSITPAEIGAEIARFEAALIQTRAQILEMQQRIAESIGAKDAGIFDAHLLVVEDRTLIDEVLRKLERDLCNVEHVFQEVAGRYAKTLSEIDDPYLRERALDIHDVTRRVIHNLHGQGAARPRHDHAAHPRRAQSHAVRHRQLNRELVLGFATDIGSKTSHTAIMARSLNIPAVVGLHDVTDQARDRRPRPARRLQRPRHRQPERPDALGIRRAGDQEGARSRRSSPTCARPSRTTLDGRHVILSREHRAARGRGAGAAERRRRRRPLPDRVLLPQQAELPSEEEQYDAYRTRRRAGRRRTASSSARSTSAATNS